MKRTILYLIGILLILNSNLSGNAQNVSDDKRFEGWEEEDYQAYEDSVFSVLYPPVTVHTIENSTLSSEAQEPEYQDNIASINAYISNVVEIDKSKEVGEIAIQSGTTATGAKAYNVPIQLYPGINGFSPEISINYNSFMGNGTLGIGWSVSGISSITRVGKNVHYDGNSRGIQINESAGTAAFALNGMRLITTDIKILSLTESVINYETEQGEIKVKAYCRGLFSVIKYFKVYYPNGNKGIFGYTDNSSHKVSFPLTSLTDPWGNTIEYSYNFENNNYRLAKVAYNSASVEFQYSTDRPDPILAYAGGSKIYESKLLSKVICKFEENILGTYDLSYITQNEKSFLSQIEYSAGGKSFNPLKFYYGEGNTAVSYKSEVTRLHKWYETTGREKNKIKVLKGKFDCDSKSDGLIMLPNNNSYWKHYRKSSTFQHSQNRFDNRYKGDEEIFIYAGLKGAFASSMSQLMTESGFVDILCADIEGKQEEYIIKVNNSVVSNNDQVTFQVFRSNMQTGLTKKYTRSYSFPTVYKDADGGKSIQPKFYFAGDFTGNGKMEILAVSCHEPFGDTGKPSMCYLFDLENDRILFQDHVFPYIVDFVGTQQTDVEDAFNKTDRLLIMDYDGDGKADICHVNNEGVNLYSFNTSNSELSVRSSIYIGLKTEDLASRDLMVGEFNGDGLMDLLVPPKGGLDKQWTIYNSAGNGSFVSSVFSGSAGIRLPFNSISEGFILQDVNGDGLTDLIRFNANGFDTYICSNNKLQSFFTYTNYNPHPILVPTNINSHNSFSQLLGIADGDVTKYSFPRNETKEALMTGMVNSHGIVEKNTYALLSEAHSGIYSKGGNAVFPYVNVAEAIPVLTSCNVYMNGNEINWSSYSYDNAVIHRQGLGFRGFGTIICNTPKGSVIQTYDPYKYGILKSEESPSYRNTYNFNVAVQTNKKVKIRLISKTEENRVTKQSVSTSYIHDTYGNPTLATERYSDGTIIKAVSTYDNKTELSDYMLGILTNQTITTTRNGSSHSEQLQITAYKNGAPLLKTFYINGGYAKHCTYSYNSKGNATFESECLYMSGNTLVTYYDYDAYGRLIKTTDPLGLTNEITYNSAGRVSSKKDIKGKKTTYTYDTFGRIRTTYFPDNSYRSYSYVWSSEGTNGLYAINTTATGRPTTKVIYDAAGRKVRAGEMRFNARYLCVDNIYDSYGRIQKSSLPSTIGPSLWNTYEYDSFDRLIRLSEPSGKRTTYSYNGLSQTVVENGISTTKTYDPLGNLISSTDPAGSIIYNLRPDGQPSSIVVPGNITTTLKYDSYGRRTGITDPSGGTSTYEYDKSGNLSKETDANGKVITYSYDRFNRLEKKVAPELNTTYYYTSHNEISQEVNSNGTHRTYSYDEFGRIRTWSETVEYLYLQKDFTYSSGNISSVTYRTNNGAIATENYIYSLGHLSEIKLNGETSIYKLTKEDYYGRTSEVVTGAVTHNYDVNAYGYLTGLRSKYGTSTVQDFSYGFDYATGNLTIRRDNRGNFTEKFQYDNLNRLVSYGESAASYDAKGNITNKNDIGSFSYTNTQKPYALTGVTQSGNSIPVRE